MKDYENFLSALFDSIEETTPTKPRETLEDKNFKALKGASLKIKELQENNQRLSAYVHQLEQTLLAERTEFLDDLHAVKDELEDLEAENKVLRACQTEGKSTAKAFYEDNAVDTNPAITIEDLQQLFTRVKLIEEQLKPTAKESSPEEKDVYTIELGKINPALFEKLLKKVRDEFKG